MLEPASTPPEIVSVHPGAGGWPGEAAAYMAACPFTSKGYGLVDVAADAWALHAWRVRPFDHHPTTIEDWERLAALFGTDHALEIANGYSAACSFAIRSMITAWGKGYTVRSEYRQRDYPPPMSEEAARAKSEQAVWDAATSQPLAVARAMRDDHARRYPVVCVSGGAS